MGNIGSYLGWMGVVLMKESPSAKKRAFEGNKESEEEENMERSSKRMKFNFEIREEVEAL